MEDAEETGHKEWDKENQKEYDEWREQNTKLQDVLAPSAKLEMQTCFASLRFE